MASASEPNTTLVFPFRGTTIGLLYPMDESYGSFYASVDGGAPVQIVVNTRGGYDFRVLARDLAPDEHLLWVVLPQSAWTSWR